MSQPKILVIIPARGGSKRIPRKNLTLLDDKPLIQYTIDVALQALKQKLIDRVIVSTDDQEIAALSKKLGAEVPFMRPAEFASDHATDFDVCTNVISELKKESYQPDAIMILRPTQPLRTVEDVRAAVEAFRKGKHDSIRSLTKTEHHPYWMKRLEDETAVPLIKTGKPDEQLRSQDLPPIYRLNGVVDIISIKNLKTGILYGKKMGYILIDHYRSIDLDTPFDLFLAECTIKYLEKQKKAEKK